MCANHTPDYMTALRLRRSISDLQKKLAYHERVVQSKDHPVTSETTIPGEPPEEPTPFARFRDRVRADIVHNIVNESYSYTPEMHEFAIILRSMCPSCYEFARTIIPMPGINHVDEKFQGEINETTQRMSGLEVESILQSLSIYREIYVSPDYKDGVVGTGEFGEHFYQKDDRGKNSLIPCVLGIDAMAIEPYSIPKVVDEKDFPDPDGRPDGTYCYFFVHYLMPIDPVLPSLIMSVVPQTNGKANRDTLRDLDAIRTTCLESGFWVVAVSGDGDTTYDHLTREIYDRIHADPGWSLSYLDFVHQMQTIEKRFITDFLHFMKCLRNRLANHPLALDSALPYFCGADIAVCLGIGNGLEHKSPGSQLKDSIALRVFSLENLVNLLSKGMFHAALSFMPIVLWRVVNQAVNIKRRSRIQLLDYAFQAARICDCWAKSSGLKEKGARSEGLFLYRSVDLQKMLSSLVVLGFILSLPMDRINLARIGTSSLEHLFGVTRVQTKGNNGEERIRRQMARAMVVKRITERNGLSLGNHRKVNISGTIDDMAAEHLLDLLAIEGSSPISSIIVLFHFVLERPVAPLNLLQMKLHIGLFMTPWFARLLKQIKDCQNNNKPETALQGFSILPRIMASERQ
jgi:hypothetical protein